MNGVKKGRISQSQGVLRFEKRTKLRCGGGGVF